MSRGCLKDSGHLRVGSFVFRALMWDFGFGVSVWGSGIRPSSPAQRKMGQGLGFRVMYQWFALSSERRNPGNPLARHRDRDFRVSSLRLSLGRCSRGADMHRSLLTKKLCWLIRVRHLLLEEMPCSVKEKRPYTTHSEGTSSQQPKNMLKPTLKPRTPKPLTTPNEPAHRCG